MILNSDAIDGAKDDRLAPVDKIVVVGTGFIGLPLALLLADHGTQVVGVDIDENLVKAINDRTLDINEDRLQSLIDSDRVNENLEASTDPTKGDAFVISVPTPLIEQTRTPDLTYVLDAVDSILPYLKPGDLINVESTIPPLSCEQTIMPLLDEAGFSVGEEIQLAHSPERILPGNVFEEIIHNDRVIGGDNEASRHRAAKIYEPFLNGKVHYTDLLSAELCKLMENTFRDVNVALANEFALIGEELAVNMTDVIDLANQHPRVDILSPSIGVGGHCLPVDPWFLNEASPKHANLITNARRINEQMPNLAAKKVRREISDLENPCILSLGMTYKPEVGDIRNSPAVTIVNDLCADGYDIAQYDRYVDENNYEELTALVEREDPDVVLQLVQHPDTTTEIEELRSVLTENNVRVLQFDTGKLLNLFHNS